VVIYDNQLDNQEQRNTTGAQVPTGQQEGPVPEEFGGEFSKPCVEIYAHPDSYMEGLECEG
jgi:hypothetical protein